MPTKTYKPIATTTLGSAAASYTFSSIPSTYTDIVLIFGGSMSNFGNLRIQFNSDTGNNYSFTRLLGDGSGAQSDRGSTQPAISIAILDANVIGNSVTNIQNYAIINYFTPEEINMLTPLPIKQPLREATQRELILAKVSGYGVPQRQFLRLQFILRLAI